MDFVMPKQVPVSKFWSLLFGGLMIWAVACAQKPGSVSGPATPGDVVSDGAGAGAASPGTASPRPTSPLIPRSQMTSGNGGGYNGPNLSSLAIPHERDKAIDVAVIQRSLEKCLVKGDEEHGLISLYGRVARYAYDFDIAKAGCSDLSNKMQQSPTLDMNDLKEKFAACMLVYESFKTPGKYDPSASAGSEPTSTTLQEFTPTPLFFNLKEADGRTTLLRTREGFPLVGQMDSRDGLTGPPTQPLFSLLVILPKNPENMSAAVPMLNDETGEQTDFRVNIAEYIQCLQSELVHVRGDSMASPPQIPSGRTPQRCEVLEPWRKAKQEVKYGPNFSLSERSASAQREWEARVQVAGGLWDLRRKANGEGTKAFDGAMGCLETEPDRQNFLNTLNAVFYEKSMSELRRLDGKIARSLMAKVAVFSSSPQWTMFQLTGHEHATSPTSGKAGYHRAQGSIFADVAKIASEEWNVIFTHELIHKMDVMIFPAANEFSRPEVKTRIETLAAKHKKLNELSAEDRAQIDSWIEAGLQRGLWAEYRAWLVTAEIYREARTKAAWPRVEWMEQLLALANRGGKGTGTTAGGWGKELDAGGAYQNEKWDSRAFAQALYEFLDQNAPAPQDGLFAEPIVQEALKEKRRAMNEANSLPSLGRLVDLLK